MTHIAKLLVTPKSHIQTELAIRDDQMYPREHEIEPKHLPEIYDSEWLFSNQKQWAATGVPLNPCLPDWFDRRDNATRYRTEIRNWWNRPYIVSTSWEDRQPGSSLTGAEIENMKKSWFDAWPSGIRYDVRCLDGKELDCSSWWGSYTSIELALARIKGR